MRDEAWTAQPVVIVPGGAVVQGAPEVASHGGQPLSADVNGLAAHTASLTPLPFAEKVRFARNFAARQDGSPQVAEQLLRAETIRSGLRDAKQRVADRTLGDAFPDGTQFGFEGWHALAPAGARELVLRGPGGEEAIIDRVSWRVMRYTEPAVADVGREGAPTSAVTVQPPTPPALPALPSGDLRAMVTVALICLTVLAIFLPLVRAVVRRGALPRTAPPRDPELASRLSRLEQAMESVAIEVERIGEAQRYSARLLSERLPEAVPAAAYGEAAERAGAEPPPRR